MSRLRVGVLVSGRGSNLQSILDASAAGDIAVDVACVISNRPKAAALDRARAAGVAAIAISHRRYDAREAFEDALLDALDEHRVDVVVLAGFMRLLTRHFLSRYVDRVINVHPSLLPAFAGVDGQAQALAYGAKLAGCTVHFVDEGTDTGPIIAQAAVAVRDDDDVASLSARILEQEHRLLPEVLQWIAQGRVERHERHVRVTCGSRDQR